MLGVIFYTPCNSKQAERDSKHKRPSENIITVLSLRSLIVRFSGGRVDCVALALSRRLRGASIVWRFVFFRVSCARCCCPLYFGGRRWSLVLFVFGSVMVCCFACERDVTDRARFELGGGIYCFDCALERGYWCESCDDVFEDEHYSCEDCGECLALSSCTCSLFSYDYAPDSFHFFKVDGEVASAFYGVELEVEHDFSRFRIVDTVQSSRASSAVYMKRDGSLSDCGVEIVSHPRSLASWREFRDYADMLSDLASVGTRAWAEPGCGLHVHVSRAGFVSPAHQARFGLMFSRNRSGWESLARRSSSYARFDLLASSPMSMKVKRYGANHFDAVNFSNRDTIEVRIFRPSLAFGRVLASIEAVEAVRVYTSTLTAHDVIGGALLWSVFMAWCRANGFERVVHLYEGGVFALGFDGAFNYEGIN